MAVIYVERQSIPKIMSGTFLRDLDLLYRKLRYVTLELKDEALTIFRRILGRVGVCRCSI